MSEPLFSHCGFSIGLLPFGGNRLGREIQSLIFLWEFKEI
jgi:hypothetical protein